MQDEEGYCPIHLACIHRIHFVIEILLDVGIDVTARDAFGRSPLHYSCLGLDDVALEKLCGQIFDTDLTDDGGYTPLALACTAGKDSSGSVNYTSLKNCMEILTCLGADINVTDPNGYTLLQIALFNWEASIVHFLVNMMPPAGFRRVGCTFMHDLCSCQRKPSPTIAPEAEVGSSEPGPMEPSTSDAINIAELLINRGISLNYKVPEYDTTPLELVARNYMVFGDDFRAMLDVLISSGARADLSNTLSTLQGKYSHINELIPKATRRWQNRHTLSTSEIDLRFLFFPLLSHVQP